MTVYVDDARMATRVGKINGRWSHMMADTREELIAFALSLGLREAWLQDKASGVHFDVTDSVRQRALNVGAVPIRVASDEWSRVLDEARQQFSGPTRPRRFPRLTERQASDFVERWVESEQFLPVTKEAQ